MAPHIHLHHHQQSSEDIFVGFREEEEETESVREKHGSVAFNIHPNQGLNLQPRYDQKSKSQSFGVQDDILTQPPS